MTSHNNLQLFYDAGIRWAKEHFHELLEFRSNRTRFESLARRAFDQSGFAESLPVRMYGVYLKNTELAEAQFVAGGWDAINGRTDEGIPITEH